MPSRAQKDQGSMLNVFQENSLDMWIEQFFLDRKTRGLRDGTIEFYSKQVSRFHEFCAEQSIFYVEQITANEVRRFLLWMQERGHNAGGRHAGYRVLKTFIYWWARETQPVAWNNPFANVSAPKVSLEPLPPIPVNDIKALVATCDDSLLGSRDRAILLILFETGVRAKEFVSLNLEDLRVNLSGATLRITKNNKPREIFFGSKSRRAVRAYLRARKDKCEALLTTSNASRLSTSGLRQLLRRRAVKAGTKVWGAHSFRRAFALQSLRNGVDIYSLQLLMGHSDLQVLRRYLAQSSEDLRNAHRKADLLNQF